MRFGQILLDLANLVRFGQI